MPLLNLFSSELRFNPAGFGWKSYKDEENTPTTFTGTDVRSGTWMRYVYVLPSLTLETGWVLSIRADMSQCGAQLSASPADAFPRQAYRDL
jgi:hypothetical protein